MKLPEFVFMMMLIGFSFGAILIEICHILVEFFGGPWENADPDSLPFVGIMLLLFYSFVMIMMKLSDVAIKTKLIEEENEKEDD